MVSGRCGRCGGRDAQLAADTPDSGASNPLYEESGGLCRTSSPGADESSAEGQKDMPTVRVFTLMAQPLLQRGLQILIDTQPEYVYAGSFTHPEEVLRQMTPARPGEVNVLMLDFDPAAESYRPFFSRLRKIDPDLRILFLLHLRTTESDVVRALRTGANGYLLQSVSEEGLLRALGAIVQGRSYLQPHVTPMVLSELRKPLYPMREWDAHVQLAERERMLLQLAADGLSNTQIADVLGLAEKTVRNMWSALFAKIGINDRTQAVLWAIRTGNAQLR
ncbi:MAG: response regulator transcription factor [Alicyclobacillus macrosporangiidus]|uniref:LuxR C-terminal-related transcriptional regulator n=1 Tax=Alicyclobacillus macrosporangiidus TaxID=392015 RepID=UPI0026ED209A|nr:response regulator transcription factor [Alicyclobacillus macrosporangiidus]MCL6597216.1 response regulator transcription factor [Alicyclobacillus macrosporangiidus]